MSHQEFQILTPRLVIRPFTKTDALEISAATVETWDDLSKWMRWAKDIDSLSNLENCEKYASSCEKTFLEKTDFTFGGFSKENSKLVTVSRVAHLNSKDKTFEVCGCWSRKSSQGMGYMAEALNAILKFIFTELGAKSVKITHADGNLQSRAMIKKIGFKPLEIIKNGHLLPSGIYVDEHVLFLDLEEYLAELDSYAT